MNSYSEIDIARANGIQHIALLIGHRGKRFIQQLHRLPEMALIESDSAAETALDHLGQYPVSKLSLVGDFDSLCRLATGHLELQGSLSPAEQEMLADCARKLGGNDWLQGQIRAAHSGVDALRIGQAQGIALGDALCEAAWTQVRKRLPETISLEVWAVDHRDVPVGHFHDLIG